VVGSNPTRGATLALPCIDRKKPDASAGLKRSGDGGCPRRRRHRLDRLNWLTTHKPHHVAVASGSQVVWRASPGPVQPTRQPDSCLTPASAHAASGLPGQMDALLFIRNELVPLAAGRMTLQRPASSGAAWVVSSPLCTTTSSVPAAARA